MKSALGPMPIGPCTMGTAHWALATLARSHPGAGPMDPCAKAQGCVKSALGPMPIGPSLVGPCPLGSGDARTLACTQRMRRAHIPGPNGPSTR
ncbi:MAG: hypothetical protein Q8Q09_02710 [Deltaproteobacteria bacterium]|nr:hypothetical protein [Deltaproteobacteria bacterium]